MQKFKEDFASCHGVPGVRPALVFYD